jgi:hypothetical protein
MVGHPYIDIEDAPHLSIIYIFGQYMKFPHSPKVPRNFHISQRKKKEKLHITTIMKKETKIILHIIINYPPLPL